MGSILASIVMLTLGAVVSLASKRRGIQAAASLCSQLVATVLVERSVVPILLGATPLSASITWSYPVGVVPLRVDAISAFFLAFSIPMTLLGTLYATGYLSPYLDRGRNGGPHFALLNVVSISFLMIYTLENAIVFMLGWELAALSAWMLVIWDYRNQKIRFAGFNYLVSTHIGLLFLVAAVMVIYSRTGSAEFESFGTFLQTKSVAREVTFLLLVTSFALKSAFFPFHSWLPRAHAAAPAHVSALMSGVIHKAGLFGILRFTLLMREPEPWMGWFLIAFSALSAGMGVIYTATQRDMKRILGYSSTENVGIAGIGFGVGYLGLAYHAPALVALGFGGGILHILNHALFKCLLFYAAGAVFRSSHTVNIERLGGLAKKMPWTAGLFLLGGLAISALPPLNGFVSEFLIYSGLTSHAGPGGTGRFALALVVALLAFVGAVSVLSITRSFGVAFLGSPRDPHVVCEGEVCAPMLIPMLVHGAGVVALGLVPSLGVALVSQPVALFLAGGATSLELPQLAARLAPLGQVSILAIGVFALLAIGRSVLMPRLSVRHVTWGCGYARPNTRMQYTGTSFSSTFTELFHNALALLRKEELPHGFFPPDGELVQTCVDAVERRMFEVLDAGEALVDRLEHLLSEETRVSFSLGLMTLVVMVALLLGAGGGFQ